jgi:uncharacterized protein YbjT (DUF2867 family)
VTRDDEPPTRPRTALLLGATGLVGGHCLELLLEDERYERVRALVRRPLAVRHRRLDSQVVDFDRLAEHPELLAVDDVFCCLGTTMAQAGSESAFRHVDYDYPVQAAEISSGQGADQFLMVSALGADPQSRIFYSRVKGEAEAVIKRLPFRAVWILRPSLLLGDRAELRIGERLASALSRPLTPLMVGSLRRYRPVAARDVALAMVHLARQQSTGGMVESDEIPALARAGD